MKVTCDRDLCSGHAMCAMAAAEVFDMDDFGFNISDNKQVPPELEEKARKGVLSCPEQALTLIED